MPQLVEVPIPDYLKLRRGEGKSAKSEIIPSGTQVPDEWLFAGDEAGLLIDMGCGFGGKTIRRARDNPAWQCIGVDNYSLLLDIARKDAGGKKLTNIVFVEGDVREPMEVLRFVPYSRWKDRPVKIVYEGVLCNLVGGNDRVTLERLYAGLAKGSQVCVADCLRSDEPGAAWFVADQHYGKRVYPWNASMLAVLLAKTWHTMWRWRYFQNELARKQYKRGHLNEGEFYVLQQHELPGNLVQKLIPLKLFEYAPYFLLDVLALSLSADKVSKHYREQEFREMVEDIGYRIADWEYRVWQSRTKDPYLGFVAKLEV